MPVLAPVATVPITRMAPCTKIDTQAQELSLGRDIAKNFGSIDKVVHLGRCTER
jgi:hypothetical protein